MHLSPQCFVIKIQSIYSDTNCNLNIPRQSLHFLNWNQFWVKTNSDSSNSILSHIVLCSLKLHCQHTNFVVIKLLCGYILIAQTLQGYLPNPTFGLLYSSALTSTQVKVSLIELLHTGVFQVPSATRFSTFSAEAFLPVAAASVSQITLHSKQHLVFLTFLVFLPVIKNQMLNDWNIYNLRLYPIATLLSKHSPGSKAWQWLWD